MDEDDYAAVTRKPLKLTKDKTKSSKHNKTNGGELVSNVAPDAKVIITTTTKAEEAFRARQDETAESRILKKASKTHKQRVEEFNKHLDSLSEHYDIPKVSWTK